MERYLKSQVVSDLKEKMVFLGGPRQVGKTTLSQDIHPKATYLNWDFGLDREKILTYDLPKSPLWIFDEIHKYKLWRNYLKGLYDKNKPHTHILVTGSARLDFYRRGGDSLQGRYHYLRLHPLSIDELNSYTEKTFSDLFELGGFPEPFLKGHKISAKRWSAQYRERILRDDISSIETLSDLGSAEKLLLRLPHLVGSPLSINALREDIQVDHKTLSRWLDVFERFYAIFRISPFSASQLKSLKKEQKHYHYDWSLIQDQGARFENIIASHLLKWVHFLQDTEGKDIQLHFFKDKEQREVDFVIAENQTPKVLIECKHAEKSASSHLIYLKKRFPEVPSYQVFYKGTPSISAKHGIIQAPAHLALKEIKNHIFNV